jgi:F420-dependent oxidoreductase-like protein
MKLSINVTSYSWDDGPERLAGHLRDLARQADDAGIDTLWIADHLLQADPNASPDEPMLEAYTTLSYLAAVTERVQLGTMVTWATIRPPALLVKMVTTLDVLAGGRTWLGLGAGYRADEAAKTGLPFESTPERFSRLEELVQIAEHMWSGDRAKFVGAHHTLSEPVCSPIPLRRPRLLIGGMGEQRTLPLVARYADACNLFDIPDGGATLRHKLTVLDQACQAIGRNPDQIEVTLSSRLAPGETAKQFTERCVGLAALGIDHVVLVTNGPWLDGGDLDIVLEAAEPVAAVM